MILWGWWTLVLRQPLVASMIVTPLGWLLGALLPDRRTDQEATDDTVSTAGYVAMGGILLLTVVFAVSMTFIGAGSLSSGSTRTNMLLQFLTLITLHGRLVPTFAAVASIAGIIALGVVSNRAAVKQSRRR